MNQLYQSIGISKQAVHQYQGRQVKFDHRVEQLVKQVEQLRKTHPGCGVEKMYYALNPDFIGRDRFVELFMDLGFGLKKKRNRRRTTYAGKSHYPNLIKGLEVTGPGIVWQSDITYIQIGDRFYYAVFIIDVFSKQIVGYQVADHMRTDMTLTALRTALDAHGPPKIHHSDRGCQYTSRSYTKLLKSHGVQISMGLTAEDNAYAERINRTMKEEYLDHWKPKDFRALKGCLRRAVLHYNNARPHRSLNYQVPDQYKSRKTITIFNNQNISKPVNSI